jgi:hypothetical protein
MVFNKGLTETRKFCRANKVKILEEISVKGGYRLNVKVAKDIELKDKRVLEKGLRVLRINASPHDRPV